MKIVFMGTPEFAVPALNDIVDAGYDVCAVVTQPDKPKGRGKKVQYPPVKEIAEALKIPVLQPEKVKDSGFVETLKDIQPDCIVVAAYGQILPLEILNLPKYGCINIHASLLPKYRGAAPIHWAIINGEVKTGITIMQMNEGLDTGDILLMEEIPINNVTTGVLHDRLSELGGTLIVKALKRIQDGTIEKVKQSNNDATYASMIHKKIGKIDWHKDPIDIERLIRGLNPWPMAYTIYDSIVMKIIEAEVLDQSTDLPEGTIIAVSKKGMEVAAGNRRLLIKKIQFPNKKAVTVDEYLRGNEIKTGLRLGVEG